MSKIKISETIAPLSIGHVNDFKEHFPNVDSVPSSDMLVFNRSLIIVMLCFLFEQFQ